MRSGRNSVLWQFRRAPLLVACLLLGASPLKVTGERARALAVGQHRFESGDVRLWYRVAGVPVGEPVVFLHGGPGEGSQAFATYAGPLLQRSLRMVYLDQRGSGRSERPKGAEHYSLELLVEDVERLRLHLGVRRIALIGHSFGTVLALEYAARYPSHVSRIVLTAATPDLPWLARIQCAQLAIRDPSAFRRAAMALKGEMEAPCDPFNAYVGEDQRRFVERNMFPDPRTAKKVSKADRADGVGNSGELADAVIANGLMNYRFDDENRIAAPVLIIAGRSDRQAVLPPQRALARALPRARLLTYDGRGHFMFVEDPNRFASDVVAFLQPARPGWP